MQPIEQFMDTLKWLRLLFRVISRDIFAVNYRDGKGFYVYTALWLSYITCQALTVFDTTHYEISIRMICASLGCGSIQVLIKYLLLGDLHRLRPLFEFLKSVYQQNSWPNSKYYKTCMEFARISHLTLVIGFSLYSFIFAQIVLFGIYESLRRAEPTPFLFIFFPFASNDNLIVYILDLLYNTIAYLTCVVTVPPADLVFFIVFANVPLISTVICCQLNELSMIIQRDEVKPLNNNDIKRFLLNYVWMHRKYNDNIALMNECFFKYCILQFVTTTVFTISGVSISSAENVMTTHGSTATGIFQIVTYCVMGTIIENSSHQIYNALYVLEWYKLPVEYQRIYHVLVHKAQRPQLLFIAGIRPLNMETCLATLKAIYSYAMLMSTLI